ncbi:MAG: polyprenyl synthetase family protein [Candidatus Mcinerneyibacterium aminivorans]|uniref:Polyprenyl synthetase family protein n=1 Tax=Candidatus Mcinerneyibacterium aminivorans TaxID=2703815 RepID=A0A5D0MEK0_9BACT|nr:MAG: polyprenyl synthetase family protein [Candidatus Mcinerneyibacterium aminivorans]
MIIHIKQLLKNWLNNKAFEKEDFEESIRYIVLSDAKYVRSTLANLIYKSFSAKESDAKLHDFLVSIELIHSASLILDDLPSMDDAKFRRGKKAHHRKFGPARTILAAFYLTTEAFNLISHSKKLISLLSQKLGENGLIMGQFMDLFYKNGDMDVIRKIHNLKTTPLFEYAIIGSLVLAEADENILKDMEKVALHIGYSYQLHDDYLDKYGTRKNLGKDINKDDHIKISSKKFLKQINNEYKRIETILNKYKPRTEEVLKYIQKLKGRLT